tara:strand:- start:500 stop:610 length:111 start_codon:yes stop_codon:yes gene_type:complete
MGPALVLFLSALVSLAMFYLPIGVYARHGSPGDPQA